MQTGAYKSFIISSFETRDARKSITGKPNSNITQKNQLVITSITTLLNSITSPSMKCYLGKTKKLNRSTQQFQVKHFKTFTFLNIISQNTPSYFWELLNNSKFSIMFKNFSKLPFCETKIRILQIIIACLWQPSVHSDFAF